MVLTKQTKILGGLTAAVATVATFVALSSSSVIHVAPNEDLQAAINSAPCGATIELDAGAVYNANLTLPNKNCADYTVIQSSRPSELPEGVRIDPVTQSPLLATLQSIVNAEPVIKTASAAHHYKFIGIHVKTRDEGVFVYDLIRFGNARDAQKTLDSVPHHIILDRSWVEGNGAQQTQRGISLNCADCGVINSYLNNIKAKGMDTQAVCGWNGTLRAFIINNYLEAGAEIVMMGGSDPAQESMIPQLVEVRRNTIRRPLEWKGQGYTIKNLVEAKNVIGFTIDGNIMENNWSNEGQSGPCLLATVRNQDGTAPYSVIRNYVVTNNTVRNCEGVFNFLGSDNEKPSQRGSGALISNNVFDKINGPFITLNGFLNVTVEHNTDLQSCCNTMTLYGEQSTSFIYRSNVNDEKQYGLFGDGGTQGQAALDRYTPNAVVAGNVIAHPYAPWPGGNTIVESLTITSDYRTPYADAGANIDTLLAAQAGGGVVQPTPSSSPSPSVTATVTISPSPSASATPSASPKFNSGQQITLDINGVFVRNCGSLSCAVNGTQDMGVRAGIVSAPVWDAGSSKYFYQLDFVSGVDGWCPEEHLILASGTPSPTATPTSTPSPTPAPTSTPSPQPTPIKFCPSGTRPVNGCVCRNGFKGSSGKCR